MTLFEFFFSLDEPSLSYEFLTLTLDTQAQGPKTLSYWVRLAGEVRSSHSLDSWNIHMTEMPTFCFSTFDLMTSFFFFFFYVGFSMLIVLLLIVSEFQV